MSLHLTCTTEDDKILSITVDAKETVENVKALLEVETGIPLMSMRLILNSVELVNNASSISAAGVHDHDLLVVLRGSGGASTGQQGQHSAGAGNPMAMRPDGSAVDPRALQACC